MNNNIYDVVIIGGGSAGITGSSSCIKEAGTICIDKKRAEAVAALIGGTVEKL